MNTEKFNSLTLEKQVDYINDQLSNGFSLREIVEQQLNLSRSCIRKRFLKLNFIYSKTDNCYKEKTLVTNNSSVKASKKPLKVNNITDNVTKKLTGDINEVSFSDEDLKSIHEIIQHKSDLLDLLKPQRIELVVNEKDELIVKTVKIRSSVLKKFDAFMDKHKGFKQQDVISFALEEFLENYK